MAAPGPKMLNTANTALWAVPVIADIKNPTVAEINAGTNITCLITAANYQFGITGNAVISDPELCSKIDTSVPGIATAEVAFDAFRFKDLVDDVLWGMLDGAGIATHFVERRGQILDTEDQETAPAKAGDVVSVASVITHDQIPQSPATVGYEKYRQPTSIQGFNARSVVKVS